MRLLAADGENGTSGTMLHETEMVANQAVTLDDDLLLVDSVQYFTLHVLSYLGSSFQVHLGEITVVHE